MKIIGTSVKSIAAAAGRRIRIAGGGSPYGPMYSDWDGSYLNIDITATTTTSSASFSGIDCFYDPVNNRLYDAYAGNNSYSYYSGLLPTSNTPTNLPNRPYTNGGRGCTVAYQNGSSYILMNYFSSARIDVWKIETGGTYTYKGTMTASASTNGGIAFAYYDNTGYFFTCANGQRIMYRHALPDLEALSGQSITQDRAYTLTYVSGYNLSFLGEASGDLYFGYRSAGGYTAIDKIAKTASTATNVTHVALTQNGAGYAMWVDYATPTIYIGGLTVSTAYSWS